MVLVNRYLHYQDDGYVGSTEYPETDNNTCPDYDQYQKIFIHGSVGLAVSNDLTLSVSSGDLAVKHVAFSAKG